MLLRSEKGVKSYDEAATDSVGWDGPYFCSRLCEGWVKVGSEYLACSGEADESGIMVSSVLKAATEERAMNHHSLMPACYSQSALQTGDSLA